MKPVFVILVPFCWTWVYGGRSEELLGKLAFSGRKSLFLLSPIARFAGDSGAIGGRMRRQFGSKIDLLPRGRTDRAWKPGLGRRKFALSSSGFKNRTVTGQRLVEPTLDRPVPSNHVGKQAAKPPT